MLIERIEVKPALIEGGDSAWPLSVPAIREVANNGLTFTSDLIVLVGANGSGKSTLLEGITEAYGLDVRGGHGGRRYASPLGKGRSVKVSDCAARPTVVGSPAARPPGSSFAPKPRTACWPT